jgi:hypothetical protein
MGPASPSMFRAATLRRVGTDTGAALDWTLLHLQSAFCVSSGVRQYFLRISSANNTLFILCQLVNAFGWAKNDALIFREGDPLFPQTNDCTRLLPRALQSQRIHRSNLLRTYHYLSKRWGSLKPGKLADLAVQGKKRQLPECVIKTMKSSRRALRGVTAALRKHCALY